MTAQERYAIFQITGRRPRRAPRRRSSSRGPARSRKYREWIRTLPCLVCGREDGVEAAHTGSDGGMSLKASDFSCIPLCADHHTMDGRRAYHGDGRAEWELLHAVNCEEVVRNLNSIWRTR